MAGLIAYDQASMDLSQRAADYMAKILRGPNPADFPVEQPTKFDRIINLIKTLGLIVPPLLLARLRRNNRSKSGLCTCVLLRLLRSPFGTRPTKLMSAITERLGG